MSKKNKEHIPKNLVITPNKAWYIKQYKEKYLNFSTIPSIKNFFNDSKNDWKYLYGSYNRNEAIVTFGYYLDFDLVNTICTTFKIKDLKKNIDTIYSFGYFEKKNIHKIGVTPVGTSYQYRYFTTGGSYVSKDGEYRVGLIGIHNIREISHTPILQNLFQDIKEYLQKKLHLRGQVLLKEFFYPTIDKKTIEIELEYYSYELQHTLFAIAWFNAIFNCYLNIVENHINEKYKTIMYTHKEEDLEFFNHMIKKYSYKKLEFLRYILNHVFTSTGGIIRNNKKIATKIGQKIIPLSISETQHPFNIKFKPWREYLISIRLSDYIINNVSPGFFITNSWFYIKNSRKGLFDNDIQYEKMKRSELAIQITELLNRAQIYTHENIISNTVKQEKKINYSWISNKFKNLSDKIQEPIDYAKEDIIMSNVALCMMSEYVGRTLWDVMLLSKSSTYYDKLIGSPFSLSGQSIFGKYMFELCYNLYCMNSISGIIHGDLHLNNATLNALSYANVGSLNDVKNPSVLYVLGDENNQYIFPTTGYHLCLIDFSRSIVLPEKIEHLKDPMLPKTQKIVDSLDEFQTEQVNRLINLYLHFTSDGGINKDELYILFKNKFEAVFKLLTTLDVYGTTQKLMRMFKMQDSKIIKPHKSCIELLQKINGYAQNYFTKEMNNLLYEKEYEKTVLSMDWPMHTIIKNCFYDYLTINTTIGNIVDVYNINNPLKFSLNSLKLYPSILIDPKYIKNNKVMDPDYHIPFKKRREQFEKEKATGIKTVNYIAVRQQQKHL